jgi:hypothetical protein
VLRDYEEGLDGRRGAIVEGSEVGSNGRCKVLRQTSLQSNHGRLNEIDPWRGESLIDGGRQLYRVIPVLLVVNSGDPEGIGGEGESEG